MTTEQQLQYERVAKMLVEVPIEWVQQYVHPFVQRRYNDDDQDYFRKMVLFIMANQIQAPSNRWYDEPKE